MVAKRFFKGLFALIIISMISAVAVSFFSCQNEQTVSNEKAKRDASAFLGKTTNLLASFMQANIVLHNNNNVCRVSPTPTLPEDTTTYKNENNQYEFKRIETVYVIFPEDTPLDVKNLYNQIFTVQDMTTLERMTAAEFTTLNPPDSAYAFQMSVDSVRNELMPMTNASIDFLKTFGVTISDLIDMVEEAGTDLTALIPVALVIAEQLAYNESTELSSANLLTPFGLFNTPAYAADYDAMIAGSLDCAMKTIVGASLSNIGKLGVSTAISLSIIKGVLASVLPKVMGPIGVAITIARFVGCLAEKGVCVFSVKCPSPLEGKLGQILDGVTFPVNR